MGIFENAFPEYVVFSQIDNLINWARSNSLGYLTMDLSCCGVEMMQAGGSRFDLERFGSVPQVAPQQADLMIVAGTLTFKAASFVKNAYEAMAEPKFVISMGSCANSGGMFANEFSYSSISGVDKILPVDVYVPGCPPRPEALLNGLLLLQRKVLAQRVLVKDEIRSLKEGAWKP